MDSTISAERQIPLPFRKAVRIAWKNIRVRLLRSLLVSFGIILALAFLMYVSTSDALRNYEMEADTREEIGILSESGSTVDAQNESATQTRWCRTARQVHSCPTNTGEILQGVFGRCGSPHRHADQHSWAWLAVRHVGVAYRPLRPEERACFSSLRIPTGCRLTRHTNMCSA